ncbi:MAG: methyltransferase domain-containing protein [Patescibacteria group bacterium]
MILIISFIAQCLLVLILLTVLILFFIWMITSFRAKVPFVPVPTSILPAIEEALGVKEGSVLYDLGCGDGRILFFIALSAPNARYVGIENSPFPLILARVRAWWHRKFHTGDIAILNQDFFTRDLSDATHIFTYLYPNVMDDLLPKLDRELKPGTRLVSATFAFTQKRPSREIDLHRSKYKLARKLYVYEF